MTQPAKPIMSKPQTNSPKRRVILYTRPGCHLCEEAKQAMKTAGCEEDYTLEEINIESDRELLHRYRNDIPVICIDEVEAFRHRVDPPEFRRRIISNNS